MRRPINATEPELPCTRPELGPPSCDLLGASWCGRDDPQAPFAIDRVRAGQRYTTSAQRESAIAREREHATPFEIGAREALVLAGMHNGIFLRRLLKRAGILETRRHKGIVYYEKRAVLEWIERRATE